MTASLDTLEFREVTPERWPDFERLFAGRGGPKNCWCMIFRAQGDETRHSDGASRKAAMERRISGGMPVGILAYLDGEPIAWCSIAPKATFARLGENENGLWSITCFFAPRRFRGQHISERLLEAAIAHARAQGATTIEAYPVDPDSPSYRFMGFRQTFERAGFVRTGHLGTRRHVMRRVLRSDLQ